MRNADLPPHHADPVDRLLVAQARTRRATLLTADPELLRYEADTLWAAPVAYLFHCPRELARPTQV